MMIKTKRLKYYTKKQVAEIIYYVCGWAIGTYEREGEIPGHSKRRELIEDIYKYWEPNDIMETIEKPLKK